MQQPPDANPCPQCGVPNPAAARFCGGCGGALPAGAPAAPAAPPPQGPQYQAAPPPPPPYQAAPPPPPGWQGAPPGPPTPPPVAAPRFGMGAAGAPAPGQQVTVNTDATTAYGYALNAVSSAGGVVHWQSPPQSFQFTLTKKDTWNTGGFPVNYSGEATVTPVGPQQCTIRVGLKVEWGSTVPVIVSTVVVIILLGLCYPMLLAFGFLLAILGVVYTGWVVGSKMPQDLVARILKGIPGAQPGMGSPAWGGAPAAPASATFVPPPPGTPAPPPPGATPPPPGATPPPRAPEAAPASPPSAAEAGSGIADQMKQLLELKDLGVLSEAEFAAKKEELLRRL